MLKNYTSIKTDTRKKVLMRDSYEDTPCCIYCGSPRSLHLHHFVSRGRGGQGIETNLVTLCSWCHTKIHSGDEAIKDYCIDYLNRLYPGWTEEDQIFRGKQ